MNGFKQLKIVLKKRILFRISNSSNYPYFTKDILSKTPYIIGRYTYGNPRILEWGEGAMLEIGSFCSIADDVNIFLGGNHRIDWITTYPFNELNNEFPNAINITGHPTTKGDVLIGNDVWIGKGASILSGIHIGHGAVIGAYSVVTKNVNPYEIVAGNPARFIRKRFDNETIEKLLKLRWWDWPIEKIHYEVQHLCDSNFNYFDKDQYLDK